MEYFTIVASILSLISATSAALIKYFSAKRKKKLNECTKENVVLANYKIQIYQQNLKRQQSKVGHIVIYNN